MMKAYPTISWTINLVSNLDLDPDEKGTEGQQCQKPELAKSLQSPLVIADAKIHRFSIRYSK